MAGRFDRKWIRIGVYYTIALTLSALSRFYWHTADASDGHQSAWAMYWHLVGGLGPFLGALAVWTVFGPNNRLSFGGTYPAMSVAMLAVPAVVMAALGIPNPFSVEPHLFGAHMGIWIALYAILEETGWRGYLQGEFQDRSPLLKYAIVGLFWYAWHFSYLAGNSIESEIVTVAFMILASAGIGFVADRTRSIFAAAAFHIIGNIMGLTADFKTLIPAEQTREIIVAICVVVWLAMLRVWRIRENRGTRAGVQPIPG